VTRHDFHVLALLTASAVASRASRAAKGAASMKLKTVTLRENPNENSIQLRKLTNQISQNSQLN
jgi:hypothetical protein